MQVRAVQCQTCTKSFRKQVQRDLKSGGLNSLPTINHSQPIKGVRHVHIPIQGFPWRLLKSRSWDGQVRFLIVFRLVCIDFCRWFLQISRWFSSICSMVLTGFHVSKVFFFFRGFHGFIDGFIDSYIPFIFFWKGQNDNINSQMQCGRFIVFFFAGVYLMHDMHLLCDHIERRLRYNCVDCQ